MTIALVVKRDRYPLEGFIGLNGKPISQEVMTKMVKRPEYAGYVHDKFTDGELVKGKHPALISPDVYWQNQEILNQIRMFSNILHILGNLLKNGKLLKKQDKY